MKIQADPHGRNIGWEIVAQKPFNLQALRDGKRAASQSVSRIGLWPGMCMLACTCRELSLAQIFRITSADIVQLAERARQMRAQMLLRSPGITRLYGARDQLVMPLNVLRLAGSSSRTVTCSLSLRSSQGC
jgi:hypothetical protein